MNPYVEGLFWACGVVAASLLVAALIGMDVSLCGGSR